MTSCKISIANRKCHKRVVESAARNSRVAVADVTSKSSSPDFVVFSPFRPYKDVDGRPYFKVPGMDGKRSCTVEGVWQGLKVFEHEGVDATKFTVTKGKGIKRSVRAKNRGRVLGHQYGKEELLDYVTARKQIYLPLYEQLLQHPEAQASLSKLFQLALKSDELILLDYETNEDINCVKKPLSHASLVKKELEKMLLASEEDNDDQKDRKKRTWSQREDNV